MQLVVVVVVVRLVVILLVVVVTPPFLFWKVETIVFHVQLVVSWSAIWDLMFYEYIRTSDAQQALDEDGGNTGQTLANAGAGIAVTLLAVEFLLFIKCALPARPRSRSPASPSSSSSVVVVFRRRPPHLPPFLIWQVLRRRERDLQSRAP